MKGLKILLYMVGFFIGVKVKIRVLGFFSFLGLVGVLVVRL